MLLDDQLPAILLPLLAYANYYFYQLTPRSMKGRKTDDEKIGGKCKVGDGEQRYRAGHCICFYASARVIIVNVTKQVGTNKQ
ncbi:hypothetical protein DM587_04615 [Vibrio fluvialis]|nr:hypothetical protein DM587_04615 [Vibrio fluvialis]